MKSTRTARSPVAVVGLALACANAAHADVTLENALADDQTRESITVYVDDAKVGTLALDAKKRRGSLALPLTKPVHRYRFEGDTEIDGERYAIEGAGLIVTTDRMDEIAERTASTVDAVRAYEALTRELITAAPGADLAGITIKRGARADAAAIAAAEKRLGVDLPAGYEKLVIELGDFSFSDPDLDFDGVLAPDRLATAADYYVRQVEANGWDDLDGLRKRVSKRYPKAARDVVLDTFELGEPTVLVAGGKCKPGETKLAFPESDFELLGTDPGDNAFMELIDYDYIMGEPECASYDRTLAYRLHDHLLEMGDDALYVLGEDETAIAFYRENVDTQSRRVWLRLAGSD